VQRAYLKRLDALAHSRTIFFSRNAKFEGTEAKTNRGRIIQYAQFGVAALIYVDCILPVSR
jgi:hypothetical protein